MFDNKILHISFTLSQSDEDLSSTPYFSRKVNASFGISSTAKMPGSAFSANFAGRRTVELVLGKTVQRFAIIHQGLLPKTAQNGRSFNGRVC
ncbi:MAG: hypothetical protein ACRYGA_04390 [Janthinobacterium lividum]